ncbi:MAG TPA: pilus assembly protein PilM [Pirellulaceae bacterium]|nr:pilus assembly protein PilM [Pirellulaceae bacterium]
MAPDRAAALVCVRCSAENDEGRKFCGECGGSLWFNCDSCGKPHSAGERFCGTCGADVAGRIAARAETIKGQLESARRLMEGFRFAEAQVLLYATARSHDLRVEKLVGEAKALLAELPERQRATEEDASRRFEEGQALAKAGQLAEARQTLEGIPEPFLSPEARALLDHVLSHDQELARLKREVKELYEAKQIEELLPRLERLVQILPGEAKYEALSKKLSEAIFERGKRRYAACRFADALDDFRLLPESFVQANEEADRRRRMAEEMQFLERRLASAVWLTPAVEAMAAAFAERLPESQVAGQYAQRLAERKRTRPADPRRTLVEWRKVAPEEIVLPTHEHAYSRRLILAEGLSEEAARLWKSEPGRFCSAIGSALQALDRGVFDTGFEFDEKKSALAGFSLFRDKAKQAWGLDCSPSSLKEALLALREDGAVELRDLYLAEAVPRSGDDDFGGTHYGREALKAFRESRLADKRSLDGARVAASLPSDSMIGRWFDMPVADKKTFEKMVALEAKAQIPIPLDELRWNWQRLDAPLETPAVRGGARMMLMAARRTWLENWHGAFRDAELKPCVVLPDAIALANYARFEWNVRSAVAAANAARKASEPAPVEEGVSIDLKADEAIALIDVGAFHSNVAIVGEGLVWFRSFGCGSYRLTQKFAGAYRLTVSQAETFKRDPSAAKRFGHLYSIAQPHLEDFRSEIERSLKLFRSAYSDRAIRRFFVLGGGSRFDGYATSLLLGPDRFFD